MKKENIRIKGLDGIRAIAVLLVFTEHYIFPGHSLGGLGVRIFFVLSGFLIIGILHNQRNKIETEGAVILNELKVFWEKRARRIFPIYFLTLSLVLIWYLYTSKPINKDGLLFYFVFAGNWYIEFRSHSYGLFSHLWSISVEQHFYVLFAPLLLYFSSKNHQRVLLYILLISLTVFLMNIIFGALPRNNYIGSIVNFSFMAIGGMLAISKIDIKYSKFFGAIAIIFLPLFIYIASKKYLGDTYPIIYSSTSFLVCLIGCACLIKYISSDSQSFAVKMLELPPIKKLGEISYGFYVYQFLAPGLPSNISNPLLIMLWPLIQFLLLFFTAWLSWEYLEKRFLKSRKKTAVSSI